MSPDQEELMQLRGLTTQIVTTALSTREIKGTEVCSFTKEVFSTLQGLGQPQGFITLEESEKALQRETVSLGLTPSEVKKSIGKDSITCLICGAKMRVLTKHLREAHGLTPAEYRSQFGIAKTQALAARSLSEAKRAQALTLDLAGNLRKKMPIKEALADLNKRQSKAKKILQQELQSAADLGLD